MKTLVKWLTVTDERLSGSNKFQKTKNQTIKLLLALIRSVVLFGMAFVLLYPLLYMISMTFRPVDQMLDPMVIWVPKSFTLDNIKEVVAALELSESLKVTLFIGVISAVMNVASCSIAGYGFARFNFRFKKILFGIVILSIIIPPQFLMIPQYIQFRYFDFFFLGQLAVPFTGEPFVNSILDTPFSLYLPAAFSYGIRSGLLIYIFRQFFRGLPKELEDAAHIDGCGPIRCFLRVMIPNAGASYLTSFLFSFVWYWNDYFYANTFIPSLRPLALRLTNLAQALGNQYATFSIAPLMQAGAFVVILPPLVVYLVFQRYFTESIERTGIVG